MVLQHPPFFWFPLRLYNALQCYISVRKNRRNNSRRLPFPFFCVTCWSTGFQSSAPASPAATPQEAPSSSPRSVARRPGAASETPRWAAPLGAWTSHRSRRRPRESALRPGRPNIRRPGGFRGCSLGLSGKIMTNMGTNTSMYSIDLKGYKRPVSMRQVVLRAANHPQKKHHAHSHKGFNIPETNLNRSHSPKIGAIFYKKCHNFSEIHTSISHASSLHENWLVVWTPLKNISQLGWLFPTEWTNKSHVPNHQPENSMNHSRGQIGSSLHGNAPALCRQRPPPPQWCRGPPDGLLGIYQ